LEPLPLLHPVDMGCLANPLRARLITLSLRAAAAVAWLMAAAVAVAAVVAF
jgi:hypothetical protein